MSADNGIYIGHFADGEVRVIQAQAIENLWYPNGENAEYIVRYFKDGKVFKSVNAANDYAFIQENDFDYLGYDIRDLVFSKAFKEYEKEFQAAD